jgi:cysteine desulfurase
MPPIYLDFNSTTPLLPEVATAMAEADAAGFANPASQHAAGRRAHRALEDARDEIARLLGADITRPHTADRLIFCSGGTEANNFALLGLTNALAPNPGLPTRANNDHTPLNSLNQKAKVPAPATLPSRIIISTIEHPSITATADFLATLGWQVDRLRVTGDGLVQLDHLDELLAADSRFGPPRLVSVMLANNETGVIQPVAEIVRRCNAANVPVHTDAAQAVGKMPVSFQELGVAAMTVAPHKFYGPRGIGALLVRHNVAVNPLLYGAAQQLGLRPGTESVAPAIGFLAALKAWHRDQHKRPRHLSELRDHFETAIKNLYPQVLINGERAERLPHTSNIAFPGHDRQALMMALDLAGICCSTGSACASGSSEPSPTLLAMNLPPEIVSSSLRFSFGVTTTAEEIDQAIDLISKIVKPIAR